MGNLYPAAAFLAAARARIISFCFWRLALGVIFTDEGRPGPGGADAMGVGTRRPGVGTCATVAAVVEVGAVVVVAAAGGAMGVGAGWEIVGGGAMGAGWEIVGGGAMGVGAGLEIVGGGAMGAGWEVVGGGAMGVGAGLANAG